MVGVPVIINHKDINKDNADDLRVGVVNSVWYDNKDGWYWCDGIIWDETAQNLITDKNWSVSCSYDVKTANDEGGSENNIKYDMEFLDGVFTHLALVNNPRYERANIVFNSKTEIVNDKWITVHPNGEENKGRHLLLKDGETPKEAIDRVYKKENKKQAREFGGLSEQKYNEIARDWNKSKSKEHQTPEDIKKSQEYIKYFIEDAEYKSKDKSLNEPTRQYFAEQVDKLKNQEQELNDWFDLSKHEEKYFDKTWKNHLKEHPEDFKQSDKQEKKEPKKYNYTLTKKEVAYDSWLGGMADTGNYYTNGSFAIDKDYVNIKGQETKSVPDIDKQVERILSPQTIDRYQNIKDFEMGELKSKYSVKPVKVAKYSYFDEKYGYERNIYIDKKYNDLFKNFDLKFGREFDPIYAYDNGKIVGVVMPMDGREKSYTKVENDTDDDYQENENQLSLELKSNNTKEDEMNVENWNEQDHPRDEQGKFTEKGGEKYEISKDYKKSMESMSKDSHKGMADFYKKKIDIVEKSKDKNNTIITKDKNGYDEYTYRDELDEYKALRDYHENLSKDNKEDKKDKFRYEGNIKIKQITKKEWADTPNDYKMVMDGKKYIMYIDDESHATVLGRCEIVNDKVNNAKEQTMFLIEELKKLITKVENDKGEDDMEIKNEKVDKRKLIDEVAGIMKSAGCDDEDIRTAIGKMEKIGYDDSEKSADNKKCKNEDKEDEKEIKNCGKKAKNEDDEEEVDEVKEEVKEDVDNKCKNSKYFDVLTNIYNSSAKAQKSETQYVSRADREQAAIDYFSK